MTEIGKGRKLQSTVVGRRRMREFLFTCTDGFWEIIFCFALTTNLSNDETLKHLKPRHRRNLDITVCTLYPEPIHAIQLLLYLGRVWKTEARIFSC